jgi:hypothetical protein
MNIYRVGKRRKVGGLCATKNHNLPACPEIWENGNGMKWAKWSGVWLGLYGKGRRKRKGQKWTRKKCIV